MITLPAAVFAVPVAAQIWTASLAPVAWAAAGLVVASVAVLALVRDRDARSAGAPPQSLRLAGRFDLAA